MDKLTSELKQAILKAVEKMEVDIEELPSSYWDGNPYGVEPELAYHSGEYIADEDEIYTAQLVQFIAWIKADGVSEYVKEINPDDDEDREITALTVEFLEKELEKYE